MISATGLPDTAEIGTDNYLVAVDGRVTWLEGRSERSEPGGGTGTLVAIARGFGRRGELAATSAVRVMGELYRPGLPGNPTRAMLDYIQRAHARLRARTMQSGPLDLGTSLTVAWVLEGRVHWVQVGGTRLYLFRNDKLVRLTPIHTQHEFEMRDGITSVGPDTGLVQAFIWGSEGLGDDAALRLEEGLDAGTEYLAPGDRLVLCTDGVTDAVDDVSMYDVLRNVPDPQHAAVGLGERARARGSRSHATAMVLRVNRVPARTIPVEREGSAKTFY